jgi:hypothetical protein
MMESTYQMVSSNGWAFYLIGALYFGCMLYFLRSTENRRIFFKFGVRNSDVEIIAHHCRTSTGYITAVLARYTALITINLLIFNFLFNVARYGSQGSDMMGEVSRPLIILYAVCASCLLAILVLTFSIFVICSKVIKQAEAVE